MVKLGKKTRVMIFTLELDYGSNTVRAVVVDCVIAGMAIKTLSRNPTPAFLKPIDGPDDPDRHVRCRRNLTCNPNVCKMMQESMMPLGITEWLWNSYHE